MKKVILVLLLLLSLVGCKANSNEVVSTLDAPEAIGPYSQARIVDGLIYTSGQIGLDPKTGLLQEGLEKQCEQVFENIEAILLAAGSDISKVIKTTVYITDINDFAKVNEIYAKYFKEPFPARSCVEVSALPKGALIECEVISSK